MAVESQTSPSPHPYLLVLGIAQDGGYPQAGCYRGCCVPAWTDSARRQFPACVAVVDPAAGQRWLFDCTPAFPEQLRELDAAAPQSGISGIFLTHAHVGHYAGLIHLGREVMGAGGVPVHVMSRMAAFLRGNGPWNGLLETGCIDLRPLQADVAVRLNERITVTPLAVPHRGEFSETVGYRIDGPVRSVLYLPDIDDWSDWERPIEDVVRSVDRAYLDGTFYFPGELPDRDAAEIPHPCIVDSMERFAPLPAADRGKVRFLHLNHTNPALDPESDAARTILQAGHGVARQGERFEL